MVTDKTNVYYDGLIKALKVKYSTLGGGTIYKATPPVYPYVYFKQLNSPTMLSTLSNTEVGIDYAVEINVYTNTTLKECRTISNDVRAYMTSVGFTIDYFAPVENVETSIYRFTLRCSKLET